jgi:hypothetical protein
MHGARAWASRTACLFVLAVSAPAAAAAAPSGRDQEANADQALTFVDDSAAVVRADVGRAQQSRDAVKLTCLNDKLTQIELAARKAHDLRATLRRASLREDVDAIGAAALAIGQLRDRAAQLRAAAQECMGQLRSSSFASESRVTVDMDADAVPDKEDVVTTAAETPVGHVVSAAPGGAGAGAAAPPSTPFAPTPPPAGSPYAAEATHDAMMLAYTADVTLAVFEVAKGLGAVESIAREAGGYLSQRSDAQVTVRVPRPRFEQALARVEKLGDVLHRNVSAEDVTDEYVDLELRLKNARALRDQLADLLRGAAVKDAVEIEKELAKVTEVIEQIEGRLKVLRDRVGFSTITVSFQASTPSPVRSTAILPFPWLDTMGLAPLLNVPKVSP